MRLNEETRFTLYTYFCFVFIFLVSNMRFFIFCFRNNLFFKKLVVNEIFLFECKRKFNHFSSDINRNKTEYKKSQETIFYHCSHSHLADFTFQKKKKTFINQQCCLRRVMLNSRPSNRWANCARSKIPRRCGNVVYFVDPYTVQLDPKCPNTFWMAGMMVEHLLRSL